MIDVLYYMYYSFYLKKMKDEQPHGRTIWALGFIFSIWIISVLDLLLIYLFSYLIPFELMIAICFLTLGILYWIYSKKGRGVRVVEEMRPLISGSYLFSAIFALFFFIISFAMLIGVPVIGKCMLSGK